MPPARGGDVGTALPFPGIVEAPVPAACPPHPPSFPCPVDLQAVVLLACLPACHQAVVGDGDR